MALQMRKHASWDYYRHVYIAQLDIITLNYQPLS